MNHNNLTWEQLLARLHELEAENAALRARLGVSILSVPEAPLPPEGRRPAQVTASMKGCAEDREATGQAPARPADRIHKYSTPQNKIALFRSLFRGREDVYARRWQSAKSGKSGYSPACGNEWKPGVCPKPKGFCSDCAYRVLLPLTDEVIELHLRGNDALGRDVIGVYPILPDDTCHFLALDFDDEGWQENVIQVRSVCAHWELPCAVERSRSGQGAHLWLFFSEPVPCAEARRLGTALLTAAMETGGTLKLTSYDRMFPNQDTLPKGGFGNLIALPLQGQARKQGNSVFVDEQLIPYPDQWAFLSSIHRLDAEEFASVCHLHARGNVLGNLVPSEEEPKPWEKHQPVCLTPMDFPANLEIVQGNLLYLPQAGLSSRARNQLVRLAAFRNPEFYKAQAMRLPIYNKPRVISTAEERNGYLALPRGCEEALMELLDQAGASCRFVDKRQPGRAIRMEFTGTLRPEQEPAAKALLTQNTGVLSATPAFGKTVVAAYLIGQRKTNTLIWIFTSPCWRPCIRSG